MRRGPEVPSGEAELLELRDLRVEGRGLLLSPSGDADGDLLGARLPRGTGGVLPPGRGYVALRGRAQLVQVAAE